MGIFDKLFGRKQKASPYSIQPKHSLKPLNQSANDLSKDIEEILLSEFSRYELRKNVLISDFDNTQTFGGPIDFVLFDGARPYAAIMLIEKGKKRTKRVHGVELACKNIGARFANFYIGFNDEYFPFKREYALSYLQRQL